MEIPSQQITSEQEQLSGQLPGQLPNSYTTPPVMRSFGGMSGFSLVKELSPREPLYDIMENLRGNIWDTKLQKYIEVKGAKPLMNDEGIDIFFHHATSVINQINTMSNYTTDYTKIHLIVRMVIKHAICDFHINWKDYGISRKTNITVITDKLMILGLSAFYHALGAGDRKASTSHISESINTLNRPESLEAQQQQKRGGMLARMLGRK